MGQCSATPLTEEEKLQLARAKQLESFVKKEKKAFQAEKKLLLLGTGDSGKSTFVRQISCLHSSGVKDLMSYVDIIRDNALSSMKTFLSYCLEEEVALPSKYVDIYRVCFVCFLIGRKF
eukprot:TRINITY_DN4674_c0_g1_i1.p1 TRINITY_DN4674_c0_g1~~TRINITY_DN4674_c0_g1_i1.p1  ORF type:complete len:119 (-),score=28.79 TRINITY_DN4674_c0_g1_i1:1122-1478(-)